VLPRIVSAELLPTSVSSPAPRSITPIPTVVIPVKDRAIPAARQRQLARALPNSITYEYEGGHASVVMNSTAFRPALLAACASISTRLASSPRAQP